MAPKGTRGRAAWLRPAALALLAAYLLLSAYVLWRSAVLTPYSDELEWIARWRQLRADGDWARYLLAPTNLHRIPWTFGLLAVDIGVLRGTNAALIGSGAFSLAVMAWALARQAGKAAPPRLGLPAGVAAAMLALMAGNVLDASQPICVDYTHGAVFAVLAVILAEGRAGGGSAWRAAAALACAVAAGLGDAAGLAVWPVLAWGALRRGEWRWLATVLAAGAVFAGLYAAGQGSAAGGATATALRDPAGAVRLALNVLALPWTLLAPGLAWISGLAVALLAAAVLAVHGGRKALPAERVACGLVLFSLGVAAMTGLGRAGLETSLATPLRYAIFMAPLQVGLLMVALPYATRAWSDRPQLAAGAAAVLLALLAQDVVMAAKVVSGSDRIRATVAATEAGVPPTAAQLAADPAIALAAGRYAALKRDGLFQHELHLKAAAASR